MLIESDPGVWMLVLGTLGCDREQLVVGGFLLERLAL